MNRQQRRRLERKEKKKTKVYQINKEQLENIRLQFTKEALEVLFKMEIALPLLALHDQFGFGKKRLLTFMNKYKTLFQAYLDKEITLEEIEQVLEEETGLTFKHNSDGTIELEGIEDEQDV